MGSGEAGVAAAWAQEKRELLRHGFRRSGSCCGMAVAAAWAQEERVLLRQAQKMHRDCEGDDILIAINYQIEPRCQLIKVLHCSDCTLPVPALAGLWGFVVPAPPHKCGPVITHLGDPGPSSLDPMFLQGKRRLQG
jgi:hypothetical protein